MFATGLLLFVVGSERLVRIAGATDGYEAYRARFRTSVATTIAIGDSRTAANIHDDATIENLGQGGDDLATVLAKLSARHARSALRRVVLQADPHQFAAYRVFKDSEGKLADLVETPPPLHFLRPHFRQYLFQYWRVALAEPTRFWRLPTRDEHATSAPAAPDPQGAAWRELASSRVQFHIPIENPANLPLARLYRETVAKLKRDGVAMCLVTHPVSSAYRAAAERYPSFAAARAVYDDVARETGAMRADYWARLADAEFGDTDHLGAWATAAYSGRVLRDCFGGE